MFCCIGRSGVLGVLGRVRGVLIGMGGRVGLGGIGWRKRVEDEGLGEMYLRGLRRLRNCLLPVDLGVVMKTFCDEMSFDVVKVWVYSDMDMWW
jgi:hypothetical protein